MSLATQISALATRIAQEVKNKAAIDHTHASVTRSASYSSAITVTATTGIPVDRVNITATGNPTITPNGGTDGQIIRVNVLASGSQRTPGVASSVRLATGLTDRSLVVPSGQVGMFALEYSSLAAAWILTAATVSGS